MPNFIRQSALATAAYKLAEEIRDGKWNHIIPKDTPMIRCTELIEELETRCAGYSTLVYEQALADGLRESR